MAYAATHTSSVTSLNQIARGFIAGFASTLMFHQGMLMLLHSAGLAPNMPFVLQPTQPLGVPEVYSLAFWGGAWGIVFLWVVGHLPQGRLYWIDSVIFGAVAPSLVAWFVVMPLKGMPMGGGWHAAGIATALLDVFDGLGDRGSRMTPIDPGPAPFVDGKIGHRGIRP